MSFPKLFQHRRNLRLPEFDYSQPGAFFVTVVTQGRRPFFGRIVNGEMILNEVGKMVRSVFEETPEHFLNVELGEFVIMPNHIHAIISITVEATHASPLPNRQNGPISGSLGAIVGSFKSASTRRFRHLINPEEKTLWQLNYYEHIIRNEKDHQAIYDYILTNPINWEKDEENVKEHDLLFGSA